MRFRASKRYSVELFFTDEADPSDSKKVTITNTNNIKTAIRTANTALADDTIHYSQSRTKAIKVIVTDQETERPLYEPVYECFN